jgi:hypothetical protein
VLLANAGSLARRDYHALRILSGVGRSLAAAAKLEVNRGGQTADRAGSDCDVRAVAAARPDLADSGTGDFCLQVGMLSYAPRTRRYGRNASDHGPGYARFSTAARPCGSQIISVDCTDELMSDHGRAGLPPAL